MNMESEEVIDSGNGAFDNLSLTPSSSPPPEDTHSVQVTLRLSDELTHHKRRAKRPRITAADLSTESFPGPLLARKRLKRPSECMKNVNPNENKCAFCEVSGSIRECEGTLLGPFHGAPGSSGAAKPFYAHYNCSVWAPEVWEAERTEKLQGVHKALLRARKQKCYVCGGKGASLSCMYQDTACCRPMHFRCSLRKGGSLRAGYETFCSKHACRSRSGNGPSPSFDLFIERTPIEDKLLEKGGGCTYCEKDSYNSSHGMILTCSRCLTRHHSKCVWPELERDGAFSALSWQRKYICKDCMKCVECDRLIDKDVYNISNEAITPTEQEAFNISSTDLRDPECNTIKCLGCNHMAIHIACLPGESTADSWRCDLCLTCKHCAAAEVHRSEWNEAYEACAGCSAEIQKGGVVCPVCSRVYREHEDIPMIQCDYCDKWLHASNCSGLTPEKFEEMHSAEATSGEKYRCPLCEKEKKTRDQERRRLKCTGNKTQLNGYSRTSRARGIDLRGLLNKAVVEESEFVFHCIRKNTCDIQNFDLVLSQLAPDVELCRLCCSGGELKDLFFCADCGDCYHEYCYKSGAATPFARPRKALSSPRNDLNALQRKAGGDSSGEIRHWRCFRCAKFEKDEVQIVDVTERANPEVCLDTLAPAENEVNGQVESLTGIVVPVRQANGRTVEQSRNPSSTSDASVICENESIRWQDARTCELCDKFESSESNRGRLIPWASNTSSSTTDCWVHVGCALWSRGVTFDGSLEAHDVLSGTRRAILHAARRTLCDFCSKNGASIRCSCKQCVKAYHYECAVTAEVRCSLDFTDKLLERSYLIKCAEKRGKVNLVNLENLHVLCSMHDALDTDAGSTRICLDDAQGLLNTQRILRIFDSHGVSVSSGPPKRKAPLSNHRLSIRVGSLSVLRFGRLVPEVDNFIVHKCLVPLGYCAMRKFWSMVHPGRRCVYILEVCGYPQSGPVFVIRCSDCYNEKIESTNPDTAWSRVTDRISDLRRKAGLMDLSHLRFRTNGLEAFGLANCIPVVTQVESLPLASMFSGRYSLKRVATHRSADVRFYNTLAKKYEPVTIRENRTGCARSEGYVLRRWKKKCKQFFDDEIPLYENAHTGSAFQLQVIREVFSPDEHLTDVDGLGDGRPKLPHAGNILQTNSTHHVIASQAEDRSRANKSTPSLPVATQHRCIASSSRGRTVILRSNISGCGVFATKHIPAGEMIIEYVGELIRPSLSDCRERLYLEKEMGCYMFEIERGLIVDATMRGNSARYINHSCDPNCSSKTICVENNQKVVVISAMRNIQRGEELSYDYQFPYDDTDRVACGCGTDMCKGFMN